MRYAEDDQSRRIEATPRARALCPACSTPVLAKCGQINAWHWAHINIIDCDDWAEPNTAWHTFWQNKFPTDQREVRMGNHRADIAILGGVLELQHSHLPVDEIRQREQFYGTQGHFAWLFDAVNAYETDRLNLRKPRNLNTAGYHTFRWKHARKSIAAARASVYLDLGTNVLKLGKIHPEAPVGGWGYVRTYDQFINDFTLACYQRSGSVLA